MTTSTWLCGLAVLAIVTHASVSASTYTIGDINVDLMPSGGKMKATSGSSQYAIHLVSLKEMANDTVAIVENSPQKHMYDAFNMQTFSITESPFMNASDPHYYSSKMEAVVQLGNNINVTIEMGLMFFHTNGSLAINGETFTVTEKQIAVHFKIAGWEFCSGANCNSSGNMETGQFLDATFSVEVEGSGSAFDNNLTEKKITVGPLALSYTSKITVDSASQDLAANFPKLEFVNGKIQAKIRIPMFTSEATYGPFIATLANTKTSGAEKAAAGLASLFVFIAAYLLG